MMIEDQIRDVIDSINTLSKLVKHHQTTNVDYETLDELEKASLELQEVTYELESRAEDIDSEEDIED